MLLNSYPEVAKYRGSRSEGIKSWGVACQASFAQPGQFKLTVE